MVKTKPATKVIKAPDPVEWNDFRKWWVAKKQPEIEKHSPELYVDHPLLTPAMNIRDCVIVVVDIKAMQYIYTSPNYAEFTGWKNEEWKKGGVQFVFSRLPREDQQGVTVFAELMNSYFKTLPDHEKGHYRAFWDFRFKDSNDEVLKCFQHDCALKYDAQGQIEELLVFNSKIQNVSRPDSQHLRMTNGKEDLFYKYDHHSKKCIQLEVLSRREMEIAKLIAKSKSLKQIADLLHISFNTVKVHHANALRKTQVNDSIELVNLLRTWTFI